MTSSTLAIRQIDRHRTSLQGHAFQILKEAILSGELSPGAVFPSVRELSQALKINPNTAQKAVAELIRDGLIAVRPGIGTVVTARAKATPAERRALLSSEVERLVVEAKRLGLEEDDLLNAVSTRWEKLFGDGRRPRNDGA